MTGLVLGVVIGAVVRIRWPVPKDPSNGYAAAAAVGAVLSRGKTALNSADLKGGEGIAEPG